MADTKSLFNDDSDEEVEIKTDTAYAQKYNEWRQKEEFNKLKTKYGNEVSSDDSSSSSEDDDEAVQMTETMEKDFLRVLAALKRKDPKIYDKNVTFFKDGDLNEQPNQPKKNADKLLYSEYEREVLLTKGGNFDETEEELQKPKKMRKSLETDKKALELSDDDEDLYVLKPSRTCHKTEDLKTDVKLKKFVSGKINDIEDKNLAEELEVLKNEYLNPTISKEKKFVYDYIFNDGFKDGTQLEVPDPKTEVEDHPNDDIEDERLEEYEHKYNFRFEDPDPEFIKRYPRVIENSLRIKDDKRKKKREEVKERKLKEKEEKMEDIRQLQAFKLKEIEEKINKLKKITGDTEVGFSTEDLDADFDPDEYDKRMQKLFDDQFYQGPEGDQKPEFPDLDEELEIENYGKFDKNEEIGGNDEQNDDNQEDEDFNMDCDYDPSSTKKELIENSKGKKKRKRKSKFLQVLNQPRPEFDPNDKKYGEYLDEYYQLDCEDIIGDLPCRFKYRQTVPNSFGLSIEEILAANDKELNRWCSLKKTMQHRPEHVEKFEVITYDRKGQNVDAKKKILPSLFDDSQSISQKKKRKNKSFAIENTNSCNKVEQEIKIENTSSEILPTSSNDSQSSDSKKKKRKHKSNQIANANMTNEIKQDIKIENNSTDEIKTELAANKEDQVANTNKKKEKKNKAKQEINVPSPKKEKQAKTEEQNIDYLNKHEETRVNENHFKPNKTKNKKRKSLGDGQEKYNPKKKMKTVLSEKEVGFSDERLKAFGINPKKYKNKLKYKPNLGK